MSVAKALLSAAVFVVALGSASGALAQRLPPPPEPTAPSPGGITLQTPWGTTPVLAWSWGASSSGTFISGGGAGAGKANIQDLSLTRTTDAQSNQLLQALVRGTILTGDTIQHVLSGERSLKDVIVVSISTGKSSGEITQTENVTFTFREFNYSADGTTATCWDIAANATPSDCTP